MDVERTVHAKILGGVLTTSLLLLIFLSEFVSSVFPLLNDQIFPKCVSQSEVSHEKLDNDVSNGH